ncbi:beta-xylosidase family glycoside hydrolase [Streptomyces europaeiscabiei]|uniref:beta-xylosidase family glycoside hydrolase n=1 Tax=Streptomyces europaeiscabiei TaxID=146819 RepID=UPI0029CA5887|nr:hypothetical protein [Streptomyces europaeiscabiei]
MPGWVKVAGAASAVVAVEAAPSARPTLRPPAVLSRPRRLNSPSERRQRGGPLLVPPRRHTHPHGTVLDFTQLSDDYGSRLRFTGTLAGIHAQDLVAAEFTADFSGFRLVCAVE